MTHSAEMDPLRQPSTVMRLSRLGSLHQSRLSFMRQLTRRMARENWVFSRPVFSIDKNGVGHAVYTADTGTRRYSLVAFAHDLPDDLRSDRVIAEAWDATFALFDGVPDQDDIDRLSKNVPLQEAGRITARELSLSRANRSVRLWAYVVDKLANGEQPDAEELLKVGYLMRTTAVYGSGKFGAAGRDMIEDRAEMSAPFQAELLSVFLTRGFIRDLVNHISKQQGGDKAVSLSDENQKLLGIGNSTGLGMAPFIINHPLLFNNWIKARETAIARVSAQQIAEPNAQALFREIFARSVQSIARWQTQHPVQLQKLEYLNQDIVKLSGYLGANTLNSEFPWRALLRWSAENLSEEGQELVCSLILEPYGSLVDDICDQMADKTDPHHRIDGLMSVKTVRDQITTNFGWAVKLDWQNKENVARAWYVSEEKLEPRLGERFLEPLEPYEQPLAPARDAALAYHDLAKFADMMPIHQFLNSYPQHRWIVRRVQLSMVAPYSEIQDNTIDHKIMPIDMLRAKLSFFGAIHFDPRSDRWVRICMFSGAPYPENINHENADYWPYPEVTS